MKHDFINDFEFFAGVPDSQLKPLCDYLMSELGISNKHIIAANEGNAVALAAGYHLATGKIPVVYLQNSGIGNIINPVASLISDKVYAIPCIFIIGWRGEPGVCDEPQHILQGEITTKLLEDLGIASYVISKNTTDDDVSAKLCEFKALLRAGKQVAFLIRKGSLDSHQKAIFKNDNKMLREEIIKHILAVSGEDIIISTTGKTSRELYEVRRANNQSHEYDFLTVGSMGHSSSIALGIALHRPEKIIWCIDGDGAALMHMGAMAVIGSNALKNMIHIIINNISHESVGGMPTVAGKIDFVKIALGCGYPCALCVDSFASLDNALKDAKENKHLTFIEVRAAIGSRDDLGRPTTTPKENKNMFMNFLGSDTIIK